MNKQEALSALRGIVATRPEYTIRDVFVESPYINCNLGRLILDEELKRVRIALDRIIHISCELGDLSALELAHLAGGSLKVRYGEEMTPLHVAAKHNKVDCLAYICKHGDFLEAYDVYERTPAHYAVMENCIDALEFLAGCGINQNAIDREKLSLCHYAVIYGSLDCLKFLAKNGADLQATDEEGKMPREMKPKYSDYADKPSNLEIVEFLDKFVNRKKLPLTV
ncbi:MAG TPA: ankyrin repeat domain-containing protein [Oligoflexia bacterium]|nr:ankyrin repeat domain-containing protein [Oligoflexia bacterium]HMP48310.1 ankyrin repeat domain-containing protein [Oligoflexia bacterium]